MRIFLTSTSRYPAKRGGSGSSRVHDVLAKGLGELGHEVLYSVSGGVDGKLPPGVIESGPWVPDADIYHFKDYPLSGHPPPPGKPWLRTFHAPSETGAQYRAQMSESFVFVSKAHAQSFGFKRYVWNGIDPDEFMFSETKGDYFLFLVSNLRRAESKGLRLAIDVTAHFGARLLVGAGIDAELLAAPHVTYLGEVADEEKAELLAGARALLFPTQLTEPFGLVIAEALISGTPVIASRSGACPELIADGTGFVCGTFDDYVRAVERLGEIRPADCRCYSLSEFHYQVMARRYAAEYERELGRACE